MLTPSILPKLYCPPPPYSESVQRTHQDRCRCIQVHPLLMCPPFPVRACAFGLYLIQLYLVYYSMFFSFVKHVSTYSNPQDRSRTDLGSQPHVCSLFSFVFRGDKSRPTADCQSSARGRGQEDYQSLSYLQFHSLIRKNKSQEQSFCFRETLRKTLTVSFTVTFRIFLGHRCILNLPYVLRIRVLLCRSPSHQPSTSHHCVQCR